MSARHLMTHGERHRALLEEYTSLECVEDRLSWLMERTSDHCEIPSEELVEERKVPGCLSGLWLSAREIDGKCFFAAKSESDLVQGVVSFICDLYSGRPSDEIRSLGDATVANLGLDRVLSLTRRRAVSSTLRFISGFAHVEQQSAVEGGSRVAC